MEKAQNKRPPNFLSSSEMLHLGAAGLTIKVQSRKDPNMQFYSVAGHIYVWSGRVWRKTSQKYDWR